MDRLRGKAIEICVGGTPTSSKEDETIQLWELRTATVLGTYVENKSDVQNSIATLGEDYFVCSQSHKPAVQIFSWIKVCVRVCVCVACMCARVCACVACMCACARLCVC